MYLMNQTSWLNQNSKSSCLFQIFSLKKTKQKFYIIVNYHTETKLNYKKFKFRKNFKIYCFTHEQTNTQCIQEQDFFPVSGPKINLVIVARAKKKKESEYISMAVIWMDRNIA